jgi:hypothetical protein
MLKLKRITICCFGLVFLWLSQAQGQDWLHIGPLFDDFQLTLDPGHRTEVLGPLFYSEQKDTQKTWALPPLFSDTTDAGVDSREYDFAYPVLTYRRYGLEHRWQLAQIFSFAGGQNGDEQKAERFSLFPFYIQQRSEEPGQDYTAVFPFYGHLKNRIFRDEIFFVAFPIFGETRKADVVTDNYLYPVFDLRHGDGLKGWQVWPFYGKEHKDVTTRTNGFGDVDTVGGHDSWFAAWPIFLHDLSGIGTTNPVRQQAILPIYSTMRSTNRDSTTVIFPFFSHIIDREKKYNEWETPWPLVVFTRGEGKTTSRIWPFFSQAHNEYLESDWYLWPVYKFNRAHADPLDRKRTRILFFLYSDTVQKNTETGQAERRVDFFPLFTHRRDYNGSTRLQILAILEPFLPNSKSIERDYSPVWSLWRAEKNTKTGAASQSLLWNLYRHETTPESKKCSLLFGLFQYQSGTAGKRMRLFYIPVMTAKPSPTKAEAK